MTFTHFIYRNPLSLVRFNCENILQKKKIHFQYDHLICYFRMYQLINKKSTLICV